MDPQAFATRLRDRLVQSRFLTVSLALHTILILVLAMIVVTRPLTPPPDLTAAGPLVEPRNEKAQPPKSEPITDVPPVKSSDFHPTVTDVPDVIRTPRTDGTVSFPPPVICFPQQPSIDPVPPSPKVPTLTGLSAADRKAITDFTKDWRTNDRSSSKPSFQFTAYIGRYAGNWNSTVRLSNGEITAGSLPNLLYVTSKWSKDRIKTNERAVKAIPLDSAELLTTKPPFIFLTGTRDFVLTKKEEENLRAYVRCGGAIWGDSSVPGRRSAFDIAFQREMRKILGGESEFEPLPSDHEVLTRGFFAKVRSLPPGINHYQEPVKVLRWNGEIAVIHTGNDYGDMWQIGLDKDGKIDLSRNASGQYVAMNPTLWENRGIYVRNIEQPAVEEAYKFGINMIVHLLTRWDTRMANSAPL